MSPWHLGVLTMPLRSLNGLRELFLRRRAELIKRQDELFREFTRKITCKYRKCSIVLFGSRARGTHVSYSDYDVAVIFEKISDGFKLIEELRRLKPRGFSLDLIVFELKDLEDPLVKKMLSDCVILYDALKVSNILEKKINK